MRGAVPCLSADLTTHAVSLKLQFTFQKKSERSPQRVTESTPRPQGWALCYARRRVLPVCVSDNPRRTTRRSRR